MSYKWCTQSISKYMASTSIEINNRSPGTQTLVVVTPPDEVEVCNVLVAEADKLIWFAASVTEELEVEEEDTAPTAAVSAVEAVAAAAVAGPPADDGEEVAPPAGPLCNK